MMRLVYHKKIYIHVLLLTVLQDDLLNECIIHKTSIFEEASVANKTLQ